MIPREGSIQFDDKAFCDGVLNRFERLKETVVTKVKDISEGEIRTGFDQLLKTLGWFAYLDVPVPEKYVTEVSEGLLKDIDSKVRTAILTHLSSQREVLKSRAGNSLSYSLPYRSLGLVVLKCVMGCEFSPPSRYPDAEMLTRMALNAIQHLSKQDQDELIDRLTIEALLDFLVEPSVLCSYLDNAERLAHILTQSILLPSFSGMCSFQSSVQGLPDALAKIVGDSKTGQELVFLVTNCSSRAFIDTLLDARVIKAMSSKIVDPETPEIVIAEIAGKSPVWYNPRIKEAVITRARTIASSLSRTNAGLHALYILNKMPEVVNDGEVSSAIAVGAAAVFARIRQSKNAWDVLPFFNRLKGLVENKEVVEAFLSSGNPIPNSIESHTLESVLRYSGYANDQRFLAMLPEYIRAGKASNISVFLRNTRLTKEVAIQGALEYAIRSSERPWQAVSGLKSCEHLKGSDWGNKLIEFIDEKAAQAILEVDTPYIELLDFMDVPALIWEPEVTKAIAKKRIEIDKNIRDGKLQHHQLMALGMLPDAFITDSLADAIQACWASEFPENAIVVTPLEMLFVISRFPKALDRQDITKAIQDHVDSVVDSFYQPWANKDTIRYVCEQIPLLKQQKPIQDALRNLGLA